MGQYKYQRKKQYPTVSWEGLLYGHSRVILKRLIKDPPQTNPWQYLRKLAHKSLSPQAQVKLEWIIFYHTVAGRNASFTASHFGISRKTLHKWLKRFANNNLASLENQTTTPKQKRCWTVTFEEQERIVRLRRQYTIHGVWEEETGSTLQQPLQATDFSLEN